MTEPQATDLAIDPTGRFVYAVHTFAGHIVGYEIDSRDGTFHASLARRSTPGRFPIRSPSTPPRHFVYVGNDDADRISVFSINRTTAR